MQVSAVQPDEWATMRAVRLSGLRESPHLFGSTAAAEEGLDEPEWRRRTERSALAWHGGSGDDDDGGSGVDVDGGAAVGIVAWVWVHEPVRADLVAMWVDPAHRGRGAGSALVRWVVEQVVTDRHASLELRVVHDNGPAVALYRRCGFVETTTERGERSGDLLQRMRYVPTTARSAVGEGSAVEDDQPDRDVLARGRDQRAEMEDLVEPEDPR